VVRTSRSAFIKLPPRSQGQIDELIERVSHLRAQNDERRDDKIKAEMHALTKKPCSRTAPKDAGRRTERVYCVGEP